MLNMAGFGFFGVTLSPCGFSSDGYKKVEGLHILPPKSIQFKNSNKLWDKMQEVFMHDIKIMKFYKGIKNFYVKSNFFLNVDKRTRNTNLDKNFMDWWRVMVPE